MDHVNKETKQKWNREERKNGRGQWGDGIDSHYASRSDVGSVDWHVFGIRDIRCCLHGFPRLWSAGQGSRWHAADLYSNHPKRMWCEERVYTFVTLAVSFGPTIKLPPTLTTQEFRWSSRPKTNNSLASSSSLSIWIGEKEATAVHIFVDLLLRQQTRLAAAHRRAHSQRDRTHVNTLHPTLNRK